MSLLALFLTKLHCLFFPDSLSGLPRLHPLSICHVSLWRVFLSLRSALILRRIYTLSANRQNPVCLWKRAHEERRGAVRAMRWEAFQALPPQRLKPQKHLCSRVLACVNAHTPAAALELLYMLGKNRHATQWMPSKGALLTTAIDTWSVLLFITLKDSWQS